MDTLLPSDAFLMTHGVPAAKKNFTRSRKCNCISATLASADVISGHAVICSLCDLALDPLNQDKGIDVMMEHCRNNKRKERAESPSIREISELSARTSCLTWSMR